MPPAWIGLMVAFASALVTNTAYSLEHDAAQHPGAVGVIIWLAACGGAASSGCPVTMFPHGGGAALHPALATPAGPTTTEGGSDKSGSPATIASPSVPFRATAGT